MKKPKRPDHLVFIDALRECLGLPPLSHPPVRVRTERPWWPVLQRQGSRKLQREAFIISDE
jgi:hypothetical protein